MVAERTPVLLRAGLKCAMQNAAAPYRLNCVLCVRVLLRVGLKYAMYILNAAAIDSTVHRVRAPPLTEEMLCFKRSDEIEIYENSVSRDCHTCILAMILPRAVFCPSCTVQETTRLFYQQFWGYRVSWGGGGGGGGGYLRVPPPPTHTHTQTNRNS